MIAPAATKPTVHEALAAITAELPSIGKDDRSPEGYSYRGIEAVTKHLQPLLAKHGVVIVPKAEVLATVPSPAMKDGWQDVLMRVDWFVYGPDGSHVEATTNGIGRDRSDKGANKAQTQAFKYLILHLFCIADGKDDADGQTYEHDRSERVEPSRARASDDRLAEFHRVKDDMSDAQRAELKAWFAKERVPAVDRATGAQIAAAIDAARLILNTATEGTGTAEPEPAPTEGEGAGPPGPALTLDQPSLIAERDRQVQDIATKAERTGS